LIEAADPNATDSVTRLGQYSVQDDVDDRDIAKPAEQLAKKAADEEMAREAKNFAKYRRFWEFIRSDTCGSFDLMSK
jgi:hypothetical protein